MRLGLLPSQQRELQRAFKKADAFDHFRQRTRRAFLGMGLFAIGAGVGGFFVGRRHAAGVEQEPTAPPTSLPVDHSPELPVEQ